MSKVTPPKLPLRFFRWFCHPEFVDDIEGDLLKRFEKRPSKWRFTVEVMRLFRPGIIRKKHKTKLNRISMIRNYVKIAPRVLLRNKLITSVSLLSLVVGAVSFQLIFSWVDNELSTNKFHSNMDKIYSILYQQTPQSKPEPFFHQVDVKEFPSVKSSLTIHRYSPEDGKLVYNSMDYRGITWVVDSSFFSFFDFDLANGNKEDILKDPKNIVISKSMAEQMFGDDNAIGKTVENFTDNRASYIVAGVLEEFPSASSMKFDILIPRHSERFWGRSASSFVLVDNHFDKEVFDKEIAKKSIFQHQFPEGILSSVPLNDAYFGNHYHRFIYYRYGNRNQVWTMSFIALMIVVICALNFINLQTIFHLATTKQLGIRQVNGAKKMDLLTQALLTKLILFLIALLISFLLLIVLFPLFERIINFQIDFNYLKNLGYLTLIVGIIVGISLVPSVFQIYKVKITEAFQNKIAALKIPIVQKGLTLFQYTISLILIIASITVFKQFQHLSDKDLGYEPLNIIEVDFFDHIYSSQFEEDKREIENIKKLKEEQKANYSYVMNKLHSHSTILEISHGELPINGSAYPMSWKVDGDNYDFSTQNSISCGREYASLLNLEILEGDFFEEGIRGVVINEAGKKYWNIKSIDSIRISNASWGGFRVFGVVKDFNYEHLSSEIKPLMLINLSHREEPFLIKIKDGNEKGALSFIETLFKEINPSENFRYKSLELELAKQYEKEKMIGSIYFFFTAIGLTLSLIGLFAFTTYENKRRTKEVGIRKVHGASITDVFSILTRSVFRIIVISICIAFPIGWYLMERWLEDYSYRIALNPLIFLITATVGLILAFIAVGWQTYNTAIINPVETLRDE